MNNVRAVNTLLRLLKEDIKLLNHGVVLSMKRLVRSDAYVDISLGSQ